VVLPLESMKAFSRRLPSALVLLAVLFLLASCQKDALVEPCGNGQVEEAKAASSGGDGGSSEAAGNGGVTDVDDAGISDDGDDISGSERTRKKKLN
jgi:hypothetical protein